ncbi:MAG: rhomboid family intramembrane serine protease [Myxococcales bacterium]|jgi:rhomboid protease GluP
METFPADTQPNRGTLDKLLFDLVTSGAAALEARGDAATLVRFHGRSLAVLVPWMPGREQQLEEKLGELMREIGKREVIELVLLGGPAGARELLERARPAARRNTVLLYHRSDDGELWDPNGRNKRPLGKHLSEHPLRGPSSAKAAQRFEETLAEAEKAQAKVQAEMKAFGDLLRGRRPMATRILAGLICAVFALQLALGSTESIPGLSRMGALVSHKVLQGEWWRLLSSSFLHGGFVHFALNTYVLLVIGSSLERLIGTGRFLAVYVLSALGASLVAMVASSAGVTVGASGGIWGLLAAEGMLAIRPRGLLPKPVQERARKNFVINLVINVANSFRPNVAMAAHFGGGAVGALLLLSGFFLRGLPTLEPNEAGARRSEPGWVRPLAFVSVAMLLVSLVAGLATGKAWLLKDPPQLERRAFEPLGLSAEIPSLLAEEQVEDLPGQTGALWGNILNDPAVVGLTVVGFPDRIAPEQMDAEMEGLRTAPEGARLDVEPKRRIFGGRPGATARYAFDGSGLKLERAVVVLADRVWRVEVTYWPQEAAGYGALAERIAESMKEL